MAKKLPVAAVTLVNAVLTRDSDGDDLPAHDIDSIAYMSTDIVSNTLSVDFGEAHDSEGHRCSLVVEAGDVLEDPSLFMSFLRDGRS